MWWFLCWLYGEFPYFNVLRPYFRPPRTKCLQRWLASRLLVDRHLWKHVQMRNGHSVSCTENVEAGDDALVAEVITFSSVPQGLRLCFSKRREFYSVLLTSWGLIESPYDTCDFFILITTNVSPLCEDVALVKQSTLMYLSLVLFCRRLR